MRTKLTNRRGMALAIAIFAIVLIGAMVTGAFFVSTQEFRIGANSLVQARSLSAAEFGLSETLANWSATQSGMPEGNTLSRQWLDQNGGTAVVRVTRLNQRAFSVVSQGAAGTGNSTAARRQLAMLLRIRMPEMGFLGALTVRGSTRLGGSSFIDGNDHNPSGWNCPAIGAPMPGVAINDPNLITFSGCNNGSCVSGSPQILQTPLANLDDTYFKYGDVQWAELTAAANKTYSGGQTVNGIGPVTTGGACNTAVQSNWGDPGTNRTTPCATHFPVIYSQGDLKITGGRGQGILLVDGDLEVQGGFMFYGPVIVKGHLKTAGTGGHFNGGVMAANVDLEQNTVLGNAVVNFSRCAIYQATINSAVPQKMMERAWVDMM